MENTISVTIQPDQLASILVDPFLEDFLQKRLDILIEARQKAKSELKKGQRLMRITQDSLQDKEMFSARKMIDEFHWIITGGSALPKQERDYILQAVNRAILATMQDYKRIVDEAAAQKKPKKQRKPRTPKTETI